MVAVRFLFLGCVAATAMGVAQAAAAPPALLVNARVAATTTDQVMLVVDGPPPARLRLRADDGVSAWAECTRASDAWRCPRPPGRGDLRLLVAAWGQ